MLEFIYSSQKPEKVAPRVEKRLRLNLKSKEPLPYQILQGEERPANFVNTMDDLGHALFGGRRESSVIFYLQFELKQGRLISLQASIDRVALGGAILGMLVYSTTLTSQVQGPVYLDLPKGLKAARFCGNEALAEKLNSQPNLLKSANRLASTKTNIKGYRIEIPRICRIEPQQNEPGSRLTLATLPRLGSLFSPPTTRVKEFIQLADVLEKFV